jgi:hypothetical protein
MASLKFAAPVTASGVTNNVIWRNDIPLAVVKRVFNLLEQWTVSDIPLAVVKRVFNLLEQWTVSDIPLAVVKRVFNLLEQWTVSFL